jgi:hypothetical protein
MTKTLKKLYHTHGALTFLLAFYPLLPNIVELHTKGYLGMTRRITGSIHSIDEVIKIMFGTRGLAVYEEYRKKHPQQLLPADIFKALFDDKNPEAGLKAIQKMFFDRAQRNFLHADKMRASIILATPEILREYPQEDFAQFRTKLMRMLANQAVIDQAIPSQLAFIEVATRLLTQLERHRLQMEKERLEVMFHMIEAKIKAELAGKASAFTAPIKTYVDAPKDPIILTSEDGENLLEVLLLLAISPAIEVKTEAKNAILEINRLKKTNARV